MVFGKEYFYFSRVERFLIDLIFYFTGAVLVISGMILFFGPIFKLNLLGFFMLLFVGDAVWRIVFGEHRLDSRTVKGIISGEIVEVNKFFSLKTFDILKTAFNRAEISGSDSLVFFAIDELLRGKNIRQSLLRIGIDLGEFESEVGDRLASSSRTRMDPVDPSSNRQKLAGEFEYISEVAFHRAIEFHDRVVSPESLFIALISQKTQAISELVSKSGLSVSDFQNALVFERLASEFGLKLLRQRALGSGTFKQPVRVNRAWTSRPTPYLDLLGIDLTEFARRGWIGFLIGHENEYQSMVNILSREQRNNAVLVGDEEIGKTSIVEHLALNIIKDNVPGKLFDKRLVKLELTKITSGAKTAGEIQERFAMMMEETVVATNVVLYIPDLHNLALTAQNNQLGGLEALEPILNASVIPVVGTTSPKLYRQIIELNPRFKDLFETVRVEELSQEEALKLLVFESVILEKKWRVIISYPALKKIVELSARFFASKPLSRASTDLLQEALAEARQLGKEVLIPEMVIDLVSRKTRVPISVAKNKEAETLLNLEEKIHEKLINQEEAVKLVASAMRQYRTGLAREKSPIASFLFVGPTGVGKTELSKVLAGLYFGSEENMIRFDMSEYQTLESVWSFIGSPDGKVIGNLTEKIKQNPFSLILFDEFEKAHPKITELFLPLLDEGAMTDNLGDNIDFRNAIIICTSNAQSNFIKDEIQKGRSVAEFSGELKNKLTEIFKPELLNRFDNVVAFRQLSQEEIRKIAKLNLQKLAKQVLQSQQIELEFSEEVVDFIAKIGFDPVFGARPLRAAISQQIKDALARQLLEQKINHGDKVTVVLGRDGRVEFKK